MHRHLTMGLLCSFLALGSLPLGAQSLSITSAFDGSGSPFIRSEMLVLDVAGADPFRPLSVFFGSASPPINLLPLVSGDLLILPATLQAFGPFDGLGLFGPPTPILVTDASGSLSVPLLIPTTFPVAGLPFSQRFQAAYAPLPQLPAVPPVVSPSFVLTNGVDVVIDEPLTTPAVTEILPHLVNEGTPTTITLRGSGFLPQGTVDPVVTFNSTCSPGTTATGTVVQLVSDGVSPSGFSLVVQTPPTIGAATAPPLTNSGPVTVTVSYAGTGLYPNNPVNGEVTTPQVTETDPLSLVYQTAIMPQLTDVSPRAGTIAGGCTLTLTGSGFLNCAVVVFDTPGGEVLVTNPTVDSDTQVTVVAPPLPVGVAGVRVRNVDHVSTSPRQSPLSAPVTDFYVFDYDPAQIVVTGIVLMGGASAGSLVEGTAGVTMTVSGTCQQVGAFTLLDPAAGATSLRLGSRILGMDEDLLVPGTITVNIPAPGSFDITADVPAFPPGRNPVGPSAGGFTNTGPKSVQIIPPLCIDPGQSPHRTYADIALQEPANTFTYLAGAAPAITGFGPNNCGREDGAQVVTITGTGFLTQNDVLPSSALSANPQVALTGTIAPDLPVKVLRMIDANTLEVETPDVSALMLALPFTSDVQATNPDGQISDITGISDDFNIYPGLAPRTANAFAVLPAPLLVQTSSAPGGTAIVFTFTDDVVTLPAGLVLRATGEHPLIIRARGDVIIDADIDLRGGSVAGGPFFVPAGGTRGGPTIDLGDLASADAAGGLPGFAPLDPTLSPLMPFAAFGLGGLHGLQGGGGGGGGATLAGLPGLAGAAAGGAGGGAYGLTPIPIPVLFAGDETEVRYPPGGSGGGAGGLGSGGPFTPALPAAKVGAAGAGGQGGGGILIAADGTITLNGTIRTDGQSGGPGLLASGIPANSGGGGGGGSAGSLVLQSLRGITVTASATLSSAGGAGGTSAAGGAGGAGSDGAIRLAIPALSASPATVLIIDPAATIAPAADTSGY